MIVFRYFDFELPVIAFDVVYVFCNLAKIVSSFAEFILVYRRNKMFAKRIQSLKVNTRELEMNQLSEENPLELRVKSRQNIDQEQHSRFQKRESLEIVA